MILTSKNKHRISDIIYFFLIFFICYVFVNKLLDINAFISNISKTGLFSELFNKFLAYFVLLIETIAVILLFFNKKRGLYFCLFIFSAFTLYISFLNYTNRYEVCGCGGILNGLSFNIHLIINIILIFLSTISIYFDYENKTSDRN